MLDVHPPHTPTHTWKDFFIHIATITVGLLIAIGLEQTVEAIHRSHQRHQLQEDLHEEAEKNREIILRDLTMESQLSWFQSAAKAAGTGAKAGKVSLTLPEAPCHAGYLGAPSARYFAPSEAVWTTAKESGLTALIPAQQARIYARLAHNDDLLAVTRENLAKACEHILSLEGRFATTDGDHHQWTLEPAQADRFGDSASNAGIALRALLTRLRWTLVYEEAIIRNSTDIDHIMMDANQAEFEK
jgi:hypothetical protein